MLNKRALLSLLLISALSACSPKVKLAPEFEKARPLNLAMLPTQASEGIRKERLAYVREAVRAELKSRGYVVLDDRVVNRFCSTPACPEKTKIAEANPALQGFVTLKVDSASTNNFLLGYVNVLKGEISLRDIRGVELANVKQTENTKGGVVFNSGQVFQGLKEEFTNVGDGPFNNLADAFAQHIVAELPRPSIDVAAAAPQEDSVIAPEIEAVQVKSFGPAVYEVCADAPANMLAAIVVNRRRSTLREVTQGRYCGIYRMDGALAGASDVAVEVRSPFGAVSRKNVAIGNGVICDLNGRVTIEEEKGGRKLEVSCVDLMARSRAVSSVATGECTSERECRIAKLLVYRAPSEIGPFEKVAEVQENAWLDRSALKNPAFYQVVAVSVDGGQSLPVPAQLRQ